MSSRVGNPACNPGAERPADEQFAGPGLQAGLLLAVDSALTFFRLLKAEATLAISALPVLLMMSLLRLPMYLLTWVSFAVLAGCAMYTLTGIALMGVGTFFIIQLAATLIVEGMLRKARKQCSLPESRKNLALMIATLQDKLNIETNHEDNQA